MRTPGAAYQFTFYDASKVSVQETDPEPPVVTGEETVIIAALAVVALFGTAIVIKKVND